MSGNYARLDGGHGLLDAAIRGQPYPPNTWSLGSISWLLGNVAGVNCCKQASLTTSAVSSTFFPHLAELFGRI
jgi:hypothetical protein